MLGLILTLAMTGCGQMQPPAEREWIKTVCYDGSCKWVWGWRQDASVFWFPDEQPRVQPTGQTAPPTTPTGEQLPTARPGPEPVATAGSATKRPINYGVQADRIGRDTRVIRASDPETLKAITGSTDPDECPLPKGPAKRAEDELLGVGGFIVAAGLFLAGAVLWSRRPRV